MSESAWAVCETKTLTELAAVIQKCDVYIGNDTAPMHLAAFVGTPVIALFGPTDPIENAPFGKAPSIVVRKDVSCNPCRNRTCNNLVCMDAITVDEVVKAVERLIGKAAAQNTRGHSQSRCGG